jgi:Polysaccharide lyase
MVFGLFSIRALVVLSGLTLLVVGNATTARTAPGSVVVMDDFRDFGNARFGDTLINRWKVPLGEDPWSAPDEVGEPWASGGGVFEVLTPRGRGFRFVVTPEMQVATGGKVAQIGDIDHLVMGLGYTEVWSGAVMLPAAGNRNGLPRGYRDWGCLLEFGTGGSKVHTQFGIDSVARKLYFRALDPEKHGTRRALAPSKLVYDKWYAFRLRIKWSYGSDGLAQFWLDGRMLANWKGATLNPGEQPYLQFGFYSGAQYRNEVWWSRLQRSHAPVT